MDDKKTIGVVTEQGYVAGSFGFSPLNEADAKKVEEEDNDEDDT